jgi:hypothetical protein
MNVKVLLKFVVPFLLIITGGIFLYHIYFSDEAIANRYFQEGLRDLESHLLEDAYTNFKMATLFFPAHIDARCGSALSLFKACYSEESKRELRKAREWCVFLKRFDKLEEVNSLINWIEEES